MTLYSRRIIFPDGDWQEAPLPLTIGAVVDVNGYPLSRPPTTGMILAYSVYRISTRIEIGEEIQCFYLEQLSREELEYL